MSFQNSGVMPLPVPENYQVKLSFEEPEKITEPIKDVSNVKTRMKDYINKRKRAHDNNRIHDTFTNITATLKAYVPKSRQKLLERAAKKVEYDDNISKDANVRYSLANTSETNEQKLLILLDKLEQEVKNIDLDKNQRQLFNSKIRKIYETFLKKLPSSKLSNKDTSTGSEIKQETDFEYKGHRKVTKYVDETPNRGYHLKIEPISEYKPDNGPVISINYRDVEYLNNYPNTKILHNNENSWYDKYKDSAYAETQITDEDYDSDAFLNDERKIYYQKKNENMRMKSRHDATHNFPDKVTKDFLTLLQS